MNEALVCIPTYNERDNLGPITEAALQAEPRADILIIDDNSPDGTGALADALSKAEPRLFVLHRPQKEGLGRAYLSGFQWALERGYSYILEMDADFSHSPSDIPRLVDAARAGADLAIGSRYISGGGTVNWGLGRRVLSRGGALYARTILGIAVSDLTGGFKCFRRRVLESLDLSDIRSAGYAFQIELTYRTLKKGYAVHEVPIVFEERRVGQSKMSSRIFLEALALVWKLRLQS
jgi:dolichol-phosphate mannosyltransferase